MPIDARHQISNPPYKNGLALINLAYPGLLAVEWGLSVVELRESHECKYAFTLLPPSNLLLTV